MTLTTTYKVRVGRPMPVMCNFSEPVTEVVIFSFGSECQDVISCSLDTDVKKSSDTCLRTFSEDAVYSAQYRAHPVKINGQLAFTSVIEKIPTYTKNNDCAPKVSCFDT